MPLFKSQTWSFVKVKSFVCPSSNGYFPITPDACVATYYLCVDYTAYEQVFSVELPDLSIKYDISFIVALQNCPSNFVFDPELKACNTFERASCGK